MRSAVFPRLTIMSRMSNEGERQRPRHGPAHTGRGREGGAKSRNNQLSIITNAPERPRPLAEEPPVLRVHQDVSHFHKEEEEESKDGEMKAPGERGRREEKTGGNNGNKEMRQEKQPIGSSFSRDPAHPAGPAPSRRDAWEESDHTETGKSSGFVSFRAEKQGNDV